MKSFRVFYRYPEYTGISSLIVHAETAQEAQKFIEMCGKIVTAIYVGTVD